MSRAQTFVMAATAAALIAAPAGAQTSTPAPAPAGAVAAPAVVSDPIDLFYVARNGAPIWLKDDSGRAAAQAFANALHNAQFDGLADGPDLASKVETAIASNDDKAISNAWVRYVQTLKGPVEGVSYGDAALTPKDSVGGRDPRSSRQCAFATGPSPGSLVGKPSLRATSRRRSQSWRNAGPARPRDTRSPKADPASRPRDRGGHTGCEANDDRGRQSRRLA